MNAMTLRLLIFYYYSPKDYDGTDADAKCLTDGHIYLFNYELITNNGRTSERTWRITDRGRHHVDHLIEHRLPFKKEIYTYESKDL